MKRLALTLESGERFVLPRGFTFALPQGPGHLGSSPAGGLVSHFGVSQLVAAELIDDEAQPKDPDASEDFQPVDV